MKNVIGTLLAVAGLAAVANAQATRLDIQCSLNGVDWSQQVEVQAGVGETRTVLVRYLMTWVPGGGVPDPVAFASLTMQPTFRNARVGVDSVQAFANAGNNTNGGGVDLDGTPLDGPFGRVRPFAATGPTAAQAYAVFTHTNGSGGAPNDIGANAYLRIARGDISRWVGTGPTSGATAVNNFNGAGGMAIVQKSSGNVNPDVDPPFQAGITNVVVMQLALTVGGTGTDDHTIIAQAPTDGMSRNSATGAREASWFRNAADAAGAVKGAVSVEGGIIHITPAPGALALLGLGGLVVGRRRR